MATTVDEERIPLRSMSKQQLASLNERRGLALLPEDLLTIRDHFRDLRRDPTVLEVEVLAQTWSEHCQHRIFHAEIEHERDGETHRIDGIFDTYVRSVTEAARERRPGFVLSAFEDNAGFVRLDDDQGVCMKVETHNHPSAIEPYAGANTGLGGVIRDVLGAGQGARPVASVDVFCLGDPRTNPEDLPASVLSPRGIFRGVVQGVRDYGNRMGIPTVAGAIHFGDGYVFNPLVFCGTVGVIPADRIDKGVRPGLALMVVGGRTGRDGLGGATFSSDTLSEDSHEEDQGSVQIGNPIEEKKMADFLLEVRRRGWVEDITDCGAGGFSSAVGEMVAETGGEMQLDRVPLKETDMKPWEIFLSESQERMVLAVEPERVDELGTLAETYETDCTRIGTVTDTGRLEVRHGERTVCDLDGTFLHDPPRRMMESRYTSATRPAESLPADPDSPETLLMKIVGDLNVASRAPVIREYDFEVQGNTVLKPLGGPAGDAPEDGVVLRVEGSERRLAVGLGLAPSYGRLNPYRMGKAVVDETVRQLVASGADPETIALLDNFCLGNPEDPDELGKLVEAARGMAEAARAFGCPFISGKDSFYNSFETDAGETISIPPTLLVSGVGQLEEADHAVGSALGSDEVVLGLLGETRRELGGSVYYRRAGGEGGTVPDTDLDRLPEQYRALHECVAEGRVHAAHDLSDGGLGVALAEMGFTGPGGLEVDLGALPVSGEMDAAERLFAESTGRLLLALPPSERAPVEQALEGFGFAVIGRATDSHRRLRITQDEATLVDVSLEALKDQWKLGLERFY